MKANIVVTFEDGTTYSCELSKTSLEIQNNIEEPSINMVSPWELPVPVSQGKDVTLRGAVVPGTDKWSDPPVRMCPDV